MHGELRRGLVDIVDDDGFLDAAIAAGSDNATCYRFGIASMRLAQAWAHCLDHNCTSGRCRCRFSMHL